MFKSKLSIFVVIASLLLIITGCTGASPETSTTPTQKDVNFRFLISDDVNAIDDFDSVIVTISSIGLQQGGESGNWTTITPDVTEVDLKPLNGENALEIWSGNVDPGEYSKVLAFASRS